MTVWLWLWLWLCVAGCHLRCSVITRAAPRQTVVMYLVDSKTKQLWSADPGDAGGSSEVRLAEGTGVVGHVAHSGEAVITTAAGVADNVGLSPLELQRLGVRHAW